MDRGDETPGIGLVMCPCFAFGSPPLSLASLQVVLRGAGFRTVPYDLDFMLMRADPGTFRELYAIYNIGHDEGIDRVQFVLRPMLLLMGLFPERFAAAELAAYAADLAVIERVDAYLKPWAAEMCNRGVRVVMCSVYVSSLLASLLLARAVKAVDPTVQIVFGGPGVSVPEIHELVLRLGCVDACASGEGEVVAPLVARQLLAGDTLHDVPGVAFCDGHDIVRNPAPPLIPLSDLCVPDFSGLPVPGHVLSHYRSNPNANTRWFGTALPIATTRGCVMRCTFCSETNYWQKFRSRDPGVVVAEISQLVERWGVSQFLFGDSLLNGDAEWLEQFADRCIAAELDVRFLFAYMRPTRLPRATLEKLARAGFRLISFGLETASQELLDTLKKGTSVAEAEQIVYDCLDLGISVNISILCGFPNETETQVLDSVRFVNRLRARVIEQAGADKAQGLTVHAGSVLRVEPNSRMYQQPQRWGIELLPEARTLPAELAAIEPAIAPLMCRWTCSVGADEMRHRMQFLGDALNCNPITVFLDDDLGQWIERDTIVVPVRPAQVVTNSAGQSYLATSSQILAQMNPLASAAWDHIAAGKTFEQVLRALEADASIEVGEATLRKVYTDLLVNRLVVVDDFATEARPG